MPCSGTTLIIYNFCKYQLYWFKYVISKCCHCQDLTFEHTLLTEFNCCVRIQLCMRGVTANFCCRNLPYYLHTCDHHGHCIIFLIHSHLFKYICRQSASVILKYAQSKSETQRSTDIGMPEINSISIAS